MVDCVGVVFRGWFHTDLQYVLLIFLFSPQFSPNIITCNNYPFSTLINFISGWWDKNYHELKLLNPTMPLLLRCADNAMPAITTELSFTTSHLLTYMLQNDKFASEERASAAKKFLGYLSDNKLKKQEYDTQRWNSPGFDPMRPFLDEEQPDWKTDPKIGSDLSRYIEIHTELEETMKLVKSGPNDEYTRAENGLLMCQRVDLWCAGEAEVEAAALSCGDRKYVEVYMLLKKKVGRILCRSNVVFYLPLHLSLSTATSTTHYELYPISIHVDPLEIFWSASDTAI